MSGGQGHDRRNDVVSIVTVSPANVELTLRIVEMSVSTGNVEAEFRIAVDP